MTAPEATVVTRVDGAIGEIVLNRPEARNALNLAMCLELQRAAASLAADPVVRVVILSGNGPAFCAGADIKERRGMSAEQARARRVEAFRAYQAIEAVPQPVIAMVHGPAVGSGGEIAAACDLVVAGASATFRYPEAVGGTVGATQRLPLIVGLPRAKELLFTGRVLPASEAFTWGLVNRVVPDTELERAVRQMAAQIAAAPPETIRLTKRCLDAGVVAERRRAREAELQAIDEWLAHPDAARGLDRLAGGEES
jgi:enoyl-CoA hydratase